MTCFRPSKECIIPIAFSLTKGSLNASFILIFSNHSDNIVGYTTFQSKRIQIIPTGIFSISVAYSLSSCICDSLNYIPPNNMWDFELSSKYSRWNTFLVQIFIRRSRQEDIHLCCLGYKIRFGDSVNCCTEDGWHFFPLWTYSTHLSKISIYASRKTSGLSNISIVLLLLLLHTEAHCCSRCTLKLMYIYIMRFEHLPSVS